jgi:TRAP transporter TAXI family solute receptor
MVVSTRSKGRLRILAALCIGAGGLLRVGPAAAELPKVLTIAVPEEGSSGYLIATGYAGAINKYTEIQKTILQPFAGSANWPARMNQGEVDFGQHCGFEQVLQSYRGEGPFSSLGPQKNIRTAVTGYGLPWGIHVVDPNAKTLKDLKGKKLFVQVSHSDHVTAVTELLKSVGLQYKKDVTILPFQSPQEATQGVMTGRADAIAFGAIPSLSEVQNARGLHTLPIPAEAVRKVQEVDPVWGATVIKAGTGPLKPEQDVSVLEIECGLAAGAKASSDTVYTVLKTMYDHWDEWKGVHPLAKQWTLKKATEIVVAPFHEGAVRFFKEKGVWTPELEKLQEAELARMKK